MTSMRRWLVGVCLSMITTIAAAAGGFDGELTIDSADARFNQGVVELNAQLSYLLSEQIREDLRAGVTLTFELEIIITRPRQLWWNADVVALDLHRDLSYQVISDRYLLRSPTGVEQDSYPTLAAALEALGKVEHLPVAVEAQLVGAGPWEVQMRAGVRRGHISDALRTLLFWRDDWHRTSDWHTWTLER